MNKVQQGSEAGSWYLQRKVQNGEQGKHTTRSRLQRGEKGRAGPEWRYRKWYSKIKARHGKWVIRVWIGSDRNGVRTGSDTKAKQQAKHVANDFNEDNNDDNDEDISKDRGPGEKNRYF